MVAKDGSRLARLLNERTSTIQFVQGKNFSAKSTMTHPIRNKPKF